MTLYDEFQPELELYHLTKNPLIDALVRKIISRSYAAGFDAARGRG